MTLTTYGSRWTVARPRKRPAITSKPARPEENHPCGWWGPGAKALAFEPGQRIERKPFDLLVGERKAPAGTWMGRPPGDGPALRLGCCRTPGDRLAGHGVAMAWSASSSICSRRSISSARYRTSDASSAVWRGRIRGQNAVRLRGSVRRLLIAARVATWGIPGHLSARRRPSGQAGPPGAQASFPGGRSVVIIGCGNRIH